MALPAHPTLTTILASHDNGAHKLRWSRDQLPVSEPFEPQLNLEKKLSHFPNPISVTLGLDIGYWSTRACIYDPSTNKIINVLGSIRPPEFPVSDGSCMPERCGELPSDCFVDDDIGPPYVPSPNDKLRRNRKASSLLGVFYMLDEQTSIDEIKRHHPQFLQLKLRQDDMAFRAKCRLALSQLLEYVYYEHAEPWCAYNKQTIDCVALTVPATWTDSMKNLYKTIFLATVTDVPADNILLYTHSDAVAWACQKRSGSSYYLPRQLHAFLAKAQAPAKGMFVEISGHTVVSLNPLSTTYLHAHVVDLNES